METMVISNSERKQFKQCRRMWNYSSPNKMNLKSLGVSKALWFGSRVHEALEAYYETGADLTSSFVSSCKQDDTDPELIADYDDLIHLGKAMMNHYMATYPKGTEPFEVLATERQFRIAMKRGKQLLAYLAGTYDGLVRMKNTGEIFVLEHKTFGQTPPPDFMLLDDQTSLYPMIAQILVKRGAYESLGIGKSEKVSGVLYNGLRKKAPTKPQRLKSGGLSKAKSIDTTYHVYRQAVLDAGLNLADYADILGHLESKENDFFLRFELRRTQQELVMAYQRLIIEIQEMIRPDVAIYPNPTHDCIYRCPFKELCLIENFGGNIDAAIETSFEEAPVRNKVYETGGKSKWQKGNRKSRLTLTLTKPQ